MSFSLRLSFGSILRRILSRRFLKFGTVGGLGTVVNVGMQYVGREHVFAGVTSLDARLNLALALGIALATVHNFIWNRLWTWRDRQQFYERPLLVQFSQYTAACSVGILLQTTFTKMLQPYGYYMVGSVVAIGLASVLNFLLNDLWTFGRLKWQKRRDPASQQSNPNPN